MVSGSTFLLRLLEGQADHLLDYLFEATSAFATVGASTGITAGLKASSQWVLIVTMFVGRVGPLTLLVAVASRLSAGRYQFPDERVTLG